VSPEVNSHYFLTTTIIISIIALELCLISVLRFPFVMQVAKIVADCMHNQLLFEHLLQVHLIPPEHVHPKL
jgi:hypothetical protein